MKTEGLGGPANPTPSKKQLLPLMRHTGRSICAAKCRRQQVTVHGQTTKDLMCRATVKGFFQDLNGSRWWTRTSPAQLSECDVSTQPIIIVMIGPSFVFLRGESLFNRVKTLGTSVTNWRLFSQRHAEPWCCSSKPFEPDWCNQCQLKSLQHFSSCNSD